MEVNAEVKRGKERQRNSPVDCFDISPKVHSTCDKIHPLPPRRHKLYIACGDFFISFFKIATSLIPLLLLFPKKLTLFGDPDICFCCKDRDSNRAIRRIETVHRTVSAKFINEFGASCLLCFAQFTPPNKRQKAPKRAWTQCPSSFS